MSSQQKRQEKTQERRAQDGYPGLVELRDIYAFEQYLTQKKDWHSCVTEGNELMRVYRRKDEFVCVSFSEKTHRTATSRHGMCLWYSFINFGKDDSNEQVDGSSGQRR